MVLIFSLLLTFAGAQETSAPPIPETSAVEANPAHHVVRRLAVFPIFIEDHRKEADAAWWSVREFLSTTQKFLVATKRLMTQKDVYQARKTIAPTDVILLSKVLDADCVISIYVNNQTLKMSAYSGEDGFLLWENSININPSIPTAKQIESLSTKLAKDFMASFPYQGFQILDPLIGKAVYEEGDVLLAKIDVGAKSAVQVGEQVQWLGIERQSSKALFQGGAALKIYAEGSIVKVENQTALVEIKRTTDVKLLGEKSLISIPSEFSRLQTEYALIDQSAPRVTTLMLNSPMYPTETKSSQSKPLLTALASVASLVAMVLLAF